MEKNTLYIPVQTPDSDDIISGIGVSELAIIGIHTVIGIITAILIIQIMHNTLYGVFAAAIIICSSVLIFRRDQYNENLIKKYKVVTQFMKAQKQFLYQYYDEYREYDEEELEAYEN